MRPPVLSVILVHYDTEEWLGTCLQSLFEYPCRCSFEVIVADNGSDPEKMNALKKRFRPVRVIPMNGNFGFAAAANKAIGQSRGRWLLLLNPDVRLLPESIDRMIRFVDRHPEAGAVGPKHLSPADQIQLTWGRFPGIVAELMRKALHENRNGRLARRYLADFSQGARMVDWVSGSCLLASRDAANAAGCLDENFFLYFEDIDWCKKIRDAGYVIYHLSPIPVIHSGGASAERHQIDARVAYRKSQFYFYQKHYGPAYAAIIRLGVAAKSLFFLTLHLFSWLASPAGRLAENARLQAMIQKNLLQATIQKQRGIPG